MDALRIHVSILDIATKKLSNMKLVIPCYPLISNFTNSCSQIQLPLDDATFMFHKMSIDGSRVIIKEISVEAMWYDVISFD